MKKLLALLLIATQAFAGLPPTTIQGQNDASPKTKFAFQVPNNQATDLGGIKALIETGSDDVLANPTFQATGVSSSVVPSWTLAGAGVTAGVSTNPTFGNDPQVLSLTLSGATGDLLSQDVTPKSTASFAGINLENSLWVYAPTSGVTLQVCARLSAADVSGACASVPNIGGWVYVPSAGSVGGTGSAGVSLFASASSTGTVYVTHGYVGRNRNLSNATPITAWGNSLSSSFSFTGLGTVTGTSIFTRQVGDTLEVFGTTTAGTTTATALQINLPSGYAVDTTKLQSGNLSLLGSFYLISSGATTFASTTGGPWVVFSDGSTTGSVFVGQGSSGNAFVKTSASVIVGTGASIGFSFKVPISQLASSVPIASLANVTSNYSGGLTGSGGGWSTASGTAADFSVATTSTTLTQNGGLNLSCVAEATKLPAITCTPPKAALYMVCANGTASNTIANDSTLVSLTDGSNATIVTGVGTTPGAANGWEAFSLCGVYNATSTSAFTIKLRGAVSAGTGSIVQNTSMPISWSLTAITQPGPQPYATGNVSNASPGQTRAEYVVFGGNSTASTACTTDPCTIASSSGFASAVNRTSAGNYTVHFSTAFSGLPSCQVFALGGSGDIVDGNTNLFSTSSFSFFDEARSSGSAHDSAFMVTCLGPK